MPTKSSRSTLLELVRHPVARLDVLGRRSRPARRRGWRAARRAAGRSGSRRARHRSSSARCPCRPSASSRAGPSASRSAAIERPAAASGRPAVRAGREPGRTASAPGRGRRGEREQRHGHADGHPAPRIARPADAMKRGVSRDGFAGRGLRVSAAGWDAEQRREQHRHQPGDHQRDGDHGEQREGVFAGRAAVKPIGTKPAIVTSVPVSIGKGGRGVGEGRRLARRALPRAWPPSSRPRSWRRRPAGRAR